MLIKKTIVILDDIKTVGHLSIIRVGQETGAKLSLVKAINGFLQIKLSGSEQECFEIVGTRMEFMLKGTLNSTDLIGVLIVSEDGEIQAKGGRADIVNPTLFLEQAGTEESSENQPDSAEPENTETMEVEQPNLENQESEQEFIVEVEEENVEQKTADTIAETVLETEQDISVETASSDSPERALPFNFIKGENFYKNVRTKLGEIMTANPREDRLEKAIPDSKWVKVYYDKDEYYVVGILTDEGDVKFLAYGVPGVKAVKPPKDAEELCDFLEIKGGLGEGYWIMFQNAKNGEIVKSID
ncbi:MAG: hypothetical protein IJ033_04930 [Clostridia bacterium]|nr:hypothetical protein [Clostridia bacterium]